MKGMRLFNWFKVDVELSQLKLDRLNELNKELGEITDRAEKDSRGLTDLEKLQVRVIMLEMHYC